MMKSNLLFAAIIFSTFYCNAQQSIEIFVNPLMRKMGDLNKQYTKVSSPYISTDYGKHNSFEMGLQYHKTLQNKLGWGIGIGWKRDIYSSTINMVDQDANTNFFPLSYSAKIGNLNLRSHLSYQIKPRLRFELALNTYKSYIISSTFVENFGFSMSDGSTLEIIDGVSTVTPGKDYNFYTTSTSKRWETYRIIPEFKLSAEVFRNFSLTAGIRFKYWNSAVDNYKIEIQGYIGEENKEKPGTVHQSSIKTTDFSYTLGLSYAFGLNKTRKP